VVINKTTDNGYKNKDYKMTSKEMSCIKLCWVTIQLKTYSKIRIKRSYQSSMLWLLTAKLQRTG